MKIRKEQPADYDIVYHVVKEAFADADHSDGNEQDLVSVLRKSEAFIPELSLVALEDDRIVGHILFTKAVVNNRKVLALAPLSVLPAYQNRGIGLALIRQGHKIASELGYKYSIVLDIPGIIQKQAMFRQAGMESKRLLKWKMKALWQYALAAILISSMERLNMIRHLGYNLSAHGLGV